MFVGAEDPLADPKDTKWASEQIGSPMIHYEVIPNFDHGSFNMANDMSYMNTVKSLIGEHNTEFSFEAPVNLSSEAELSLVTPVYLLEKPNCFQAYLRKPRGHQILMDNGGKDGTCVSLGYTHFV